MSKVRSVAAMAVVGCLALGGWSYVQAKTAKLTAEDYTEITELYARLYQGGDLRELDLWLSNFVDDAAYGFPNGDSVTGKTALTEWRKKSWAGQTGDSKRRHWTSGVALTPLPDGTVKGRAYWMMIDGKDKLPVVAQSGLFDDLYVKTPSGWKFKRHAVKMDPSS
jgi:3-phenylpropionate/cinnamic acid dioxygenase small subunit